MLIVPYVWCRSTVNDIPLDLIDLAADVRSFVQEYRKGHRDTNKLIHRECLETRMHISTTIQGTNEAVERVGQDVSKLALNVDNQVDQAKRERLLQSLKYPGFNERRNEVREAHPATFQWVFVGDDGKSAGPDSKMSTINWDSFPNWLKSTDTFYWISGKPGSGKSTMLKYILADPQMRVAQRSLEIWSPGCLIISHYFWRAGNPMQRTIKGLFCSLLCQLLENSEESLRQLFKSREEAFGRNLGPATVSSMKSDFTDWSLTELHSTLRNTIKNYDRPICMFLDGLDEVYPDQPSNLLDMIKELAVIGKTKMCLASRPEPPLQRRLYNIPQLRLQDLTAADLTKYARDELRLFESRTNNEFVSSLVKRAEGVFLWLVLVIKSVRNGFDNGDTIDIINERVDRLKNGDLESLYKDMWDRASKDNPDAYRRTAALYFRLMLLYTRGANKHLRIYGNNLSVFTMMLSTTENAEQTLNAAPLSLNFVSERTLLQSCTEVERIAEIYCFGLLEVSDREHDEVIENMVSWYRGKYDKLLPYAQVRRALVFVHRTAVDFLVDTAQGKEILSFDNTAESSHAFRLVKANLAHARMFCVFTGMDMTGRRSNPSLASTHFRSIDIVRRTYVNADEPVIADYVPIMIHFQRLCDSEKVFAGVDSNETFVCSGVDFFKAAAWYTWRCLNIFEDQIKALNKETLSEILHIFCSHFLCYHANDDSGIFDGDALRLVRLLLTGGADPNWNGTTGFADVQWAEDDDKPYICRRTPFVAFLSRALKHAQRDNYEARCRSGKELSRNDLTDMLVTLQTFIRCGADLDEKVTIVLGVACDHSTTHNLKSREPCQHIKCGTFWRWEHLFYEVKSFKNGYQYICSVPVYNMLNRMLSEWESLGRLSIESTLLTNVKSSVAYGTSGRSRMTRNDSMFVRLEITSFAFKNPSDWGEAKWRWRVATPTHQGQIANELMSFVTLPERSGRLEKSCDARFSTATQTLGYDALTSMIYGSHWVRQGSGYLEHVFDYLVELRMFARYSNPRELHSIRGRLKREGALPPP